MAKEFGEMRSKDYLGATDKLSFDEGLSPEKEAIHNLEAEVRHSIGSGASEKESNAEALGSYPKTPSQVLAILEGYTDSLAAQIDKNFTSANSLKLNRGPLQVTLDKEKGGYSYILSSYGNKTSFSFVPGNSKLLKESGTFVLEGGNKKITTWVWGLDKFTSEYWIKSFLNYANSANKEIYRCEEITRLKTIKSKIKNPANKNNLAGYKKDYNKIMKQDNFYALTFDKNIEASIAWGSVSDANRITYMNTRWSEIKKQSQEELAPLFQEKGVS